MTDRRRRVLGKPLDHDEGLSIGRRTKLRIRYEDNHIFNRTTAKAIPITLYLVALRLIDDLKPTTFDGRDLLASHNLVTLIVNLRVSVGVQLNIIFKVRPPVAKSVQALHDP